MIIFTNKISKISFVLYFLFCIARNNSILCEENIFYEDKTDVKKKYTTYILTYNSLCIQNINPFYDYFTKYNNLQKRGKHIYIVRNKYELIRLFFNFSFSKTTWKNTRYGFFYKINILENYYSCFNIPNINYKHEFVGILAFYYGINISYNNNGTFIKNSINIGCKIAGGLIWSRFNFLLLYNYKQDNNTYYTPSYKDKQKKEDLKIKNVLCDWHNWTNFDIILDIIPLYIQFKKIFYINIEYKLGLFDIICTLKEYAKSTDTNKKKLFNHLLFNISINIGIY